MILSIPQPTPKVSSALRFVAWTTIVILFAIVCMDHVHADDLMAKGKGTVNDTFGKDSTFATWLILGEIVIGAFMYIKTKNLMLLAGVAVVIVFLNVAFGLI
ncbi:TPA: TraA fimbrial protein precursor [Aeromonas hydrophila]|nr:TraA fimbrial protein precursor [Aeromonas hydrophila]HAT2496826.1 TraA fimbrial protein precursor [Aeromonas hydrophila]HAT2512588.1 TraA fimbrial protein precursor [Aeromonas hydrophila]HAT2533033.1 TraA fimbrial protein precursor [Aeromonas hydrophila]HDX8371641.1 TraA fimbrial protein precursor [Aeromonas dhakensis]